MAIFTWTPDRAASSETEAKVLSAPFGDGYSQEVPDGLNNMPETWELTFSVRTTAEIKAIRDFLVAHKGATYFTWTTPAGDTLKFTCKKWRATWGTSADNSITCTFKQDFRL